MVTQAVTLLHDRVAGRALIRIAIALSAGSVLSLWWLMEKLPSKSFLAFLSFLVLGSGMFLTGWLRDVLAFRGKQYLARSEPAESLDDPRPPVLLLRPFQSDATGLPKPSVQLKERGRERGDFSTFEEHIAKSLSPIGPLVALGRPGEAFPPLGAHRFHETDQTWRDRVVGLLRRARIVILIPGTSQALNWETMTAFGELKPQQLVILGVGTDTPLQYEALTKMCKEATGRRLPHPRHLGVAKETGITFDEGWAPRILRLGDSRWRSVDARWHYALEPVFRANGIKWSPLSSPLSFFRIVTAGVGTLLTLQIIKKLGLTDMQGGWVTMIPAVWVTMIPGVVAMLAWGWISDRLAERLARSSVLQQLLYPLLQKHRSALASLLADMLPIKADTRAATASPSIRHERNGSLLAAIAIKGNREEKSFSARVISRTPALSRRARMRGNRHA